MMVCTVVSCSQQWSGSFLLFSFGLGVRCGSILVLESSFSLALSLALALALSFSISPLPLAFSFSRTRVVVWIIAVRFASPSLVFRWGFSFKNSLMVLIPLSAPRRILTLSFCAGASWVPCTPQSIASSWLFVMFA
jgi:hypothetical protein